MIFIQLLCQELNMDKNDMLGYFNELKYSGIDDDNQYDMFENYDISKLDISRIYRYLDYLTLSDEETDNYNSIINLNQEIKEY